MALRTYRIHLTGQSPLLMHADDLAWRAGMERWLAEPENKRQSKAGDDRTPAWRWLGYVYHDRQVVGIPSDNLMTLFREGGAKVPIPGRKETFKRQSQSGILVNELLWPLEVQGHTILWPELAKLQENEDFAAHEAAAAAQDFVLFLKSAKVGQSKHIRVRPRFEEWQCAGTVTVTDDSITPDVLEAILHMAGVYCGLGDWRPSSPSKPGPFGRFVATIEEQ